MSYDHAKTRDLLKIAAAYAQHPLGEFVAQLSTQLFDAEAEISAITKTVADARSEVDEANRRLLAESQAHRATKDKLTADIQALEAKNKEMMVALSDIALDARGAKKIAADVLTNISAAPEVKP